MGSPYLQVTSTRFTMDSDLLTVNNINLTQARLGNHTIWPWGMAGVFFHACALTYLAPSPYKIQLLASRYTATSANALEIESRSGNISAQSFQTLSVTATFGNVQVTSNSTFTPVYRRLAHGYMDSGDCSSVQTRACACTCPLPLANLQI